jgi:peroxiredoxin Q/BCP
MVLKIHSPAPDFTLLDGEGVAHTLKEYSGRYLLIYFYPKDDTPGCTTEACSLRDNLPHFEKSGITVLGISPDSVKSHKKFADKFALPFTLLADENKTVVNAYGVWEKKKFMGREYDGVFRTSFLIDPQGKIVKIYEDVKPAKHVAEVLTDFAELTRSPK